MATSTVRENRRQMSKAFYHSTLATALERFGRDELPLIPTVPQLPEILVFLLLTSQKPPIFLENMAIRLKNRGYLAITHQYR
jgi:hypothetical protein